MTESRWPEARALFEAALELSAAERSLFVERRAGADPELLAEVRSLLESHAGARGFLDGTAVGVLRDLGESGLLGVARERIGPWRIVRPLGAGGMGQVYLGERASGDYEQRVAIKVVAGGFASAEVLRRFHVERRILASLEHPGIARLLDGGTTEEGLPYFVMEYVAGSGILEYADQHRLDVRARIELFLEVCAAVEHAHQRLVVHRDLKPSNILVGADGRPKLLDFGIGKLLQSVEEGVAADRTVTRMRWLTPDYASPEQLMGRPTTTATDVFGLGMVLYELLCGKRAHRVSTQGSSSSDVALPGWMPRRPSTVALEAGGTAGSPRTAQERAAARSCSPARLRRQLRGDLDTVVGTALATDPARRYASAAELATDLRRHLGGRPIHARPTSPAQRLAKLVLRHRVASFATAGGLLLLVAFTVYHTATLERERNAAKLEAANAEEIASFLTKLFEGANLVQTGGATLSARDLLERGEKQLEERTDLATAIRARLLVTLSLARESLGDVARAGELASRAADLHERAGSPPEALVFALLLKAHFLMGSGHDRESLPIVERASALASSSPDVSLKTRAKVAMSLGNIFYGVGDQARAKAAYDRFVELEKQIGEPSRIGMALNNVGALLGIMGDEAASRARYQEAVAYFEKSTEKVAYEIYLPLFNLAELDLEAGNAAAAEAAVRRGLAAHEKVFGPETTEAAWGLGALAEVERQRGELERARASIERALALDSRLADTDEENRSWLLRISGKIHVDAGNPNAGIGELEQALAIEHGMQGDRSVWIAPIEAALAKARASGAAAPKPPPPRVPGPD